LIVRLALLLSAVLLAGCSTAGLEPPSSAGSAIAASAAMEQDPRYAAIVIDAGSGAALFTDHADAQRHPASLTKMMTLYLLFEAMDAGRLTPRTMLAVSSAAARQPPSKLGLKAGASILVSDAVLATAVHSSNDVAVVIAERLAGSESAFALQMNAKARALGMRATHFVNASGLPDPRQVTTARDMAILARALRQDFPARYRVFSTRTFAYDGRRYQSTNELLGKVRGVDGVKTGYIRASGFNLAASAGSGGRRIVVVVMGGRTGAQRNAKVTQLIEDYSAGGLFAFR
jgi:D-alanyl-D-alanine carboxypeptidase